MAGLLTVLKLVPWGEVISNAPKVVEGARKLWNTMDRNKGGAAPNQAAPSGVTDIVEVSDAQAIQRLRSRLGDAEGQIAQLHEQVRASSDLIRELAEQNAQLIQRMDANQQRMRWLVRGSAVLFVALLGAVGYLLGR